MSRSVLGSVLSRSAALVVAGALAVSGPAAAQLARPRTAAPDAPKLLILPFDRDARDSALSLVVADGVRERMRTAYLDKFNTITRENLCRNLTESGFPCDVPLDAQTKRTLVRFLSARYVIEGWMIRRGDSILVVTRLSEATGMAPTAVSASMIGAAQRIGASTGSDLANRMVEGFRSFDEVAECRRKLDLQDYAGARRQADAALRQFPSNAGAYLCIARIFEAQNGSADSIVSALRTAYEKDTLNTAVMRMLASRYQARGDTTRLLDMLKRILTIDFRDNDLRINTIRLMVQMGQVDDALELVNQGLRDNPASAELLGAKAIAMAAASKWDSAATAMIMVADIDSSRVDSLFLFRLTNYLKQIPDSAGYFRWVRVATGKFPEQAPYWYTLADLQFARGDTTGAIASAQRYVALRGDDGVGHLALARYQVAAGQLDSALVHAQAVTDTALISFTGPIYLAAGVKSYRDSLWTQAIQRLTVAKERTTGAARATSAFVLAISQFKIAVHTDSIAEASHNCDSARAARALWDQVEQNMIAGAAQDRTTANNFLSQYIPAYKGREDTMIRQYCR